ncbi:MAG: N-6 DNA methylase [Herpetosiphonaceae bacterium]|nr:N-6 DNA methylase [Herpetosiphonaceae bacterium]
MHPVEAYLQDLHTIHASGSAVRETSYYPALERLLNEIGKLLKPRVRCVLTLRNQGAGIPDGGLFTADQFQRSAAGEPLPGQLPARGVVEVKGTNADVQVIAHSEQVKKYLARYGQVLVTNYRDFLLVGPGPEGGASELEAYHLAANEATFWNSSPHVLAEAHGAQLTEYLKRVMLHAAVLSNPADVAWFLASYARDARARIGDRNVPALASIRQALEQALGITFEGERGDHFFRSTLIQTLFYGVFSAWVLWHEEDPERTDRFDWRLAEHYLHVPIIQALFEQVSGPTKLRPLQLMEVLGWTGAALNRVDRTTFFQKFEQGLAVQYFYEPFLEAFDPELRKELGVWYTPPEIVEYMVARVDTALREELGIADGLADPQVYVLDPCCGTGAYLVEVLRRIEGTLRAQGDDALVAAEIKRAARERVFGFELLPAPFVVAHLQMGLLLQRLGAPFDDETNERGAIFLTNALTGWEPANEPKTMLMFPELEQERDAAEHVKRDVPILVILGNPPYNGFAGLAVEEERVLSNAYRATKRAPAPQGQGLNDLYVRFFRMAERRITEQTGRGIVCFISNYSWLDGLSFTGMRERYLETFDELWIDNLHGDRIISEYSPDGQTSETVFAAPGTSPGIKIGTAISLLIRKNRIERSGAQILYRDMDQARASARKVALLTSLRQPNIRQEYAALAPIAEIGLPFKPRAISDTYLAWPLLSDLFPVSFPGVKTSRDDVVVDTDRDRLARRMEQYFNPQISHEEMRRLVPGAMGGEGGFNAVSTRDYLIKRGFLDKNIIRYCYRPFDLRWLYWEPETKLLDRNRAEYFPHVFEGNIWIEARQKQAMEHFDRGYVVRVLSDNFGNGLSNYFPLYLGTGSTQPSLLDHGISFTPKPNLGAAAIRYLTALGGDEHDLFYHAVAVLHAPAYRAENDGALRQDWPRIPLPVGKEMLLHSAVLGRQIAALLNPETPVSGVTTGTIRPELRIIGGVARMGDTSINATAGDLDVTAGWGHGGNGRVVMPARGKIVSRAYSAEEQAAFAAAGAEARLGTTTYDVYLNDRAYWRNIPSKVWEYTIGGYQVVKKWLSYREKTVLRRGLTLDEVREVTAMARRIAAILLLEPELDASYEAVKGCGIAPA